MSGWWVAGLWGGAGLLLALALCRAAAIGDRDPEGDHQP